MRPQSVTRSHLVPLACLAFLCLFGSRLSNAGDTLTAGEVMKDWEFLESQNKMFQFLFLYPSYSSKRYLGIQFMHYFGMKMVWVANRENPLNDTSGYLSITENGYLMIRDEGGTSIVINSGEPMNHSNTSLTLLDSGNLVMKAGQQVVWQSFDHPTDTILPGMKFGLFDLKLRQPHKRFLTSWVGPGVPAEGAFTLGVNPNNSKQLEVWRRGVPYWRSESPNGRNLSDFPFGRRGYTSLNFSYTANDYESYFTYSPTEDNFSWIEMNSTGNIRIFLSDISSASLGYAIECDGVKEYRSAGCIVQMPSKCSSGEEFVLIVGAMDSWNYWQNHSLGISDCEEACRNDCSCTAYGSASPDGSGCKFSDGQRDINPPIEWTEFFYIRNTTAKNDTRAAPTQPIIKNVTAPTVVPADKETPTNKKKWVNIVSIMVSLSLLALICSLCYLIWKKCFSEGRRGSNRDQVGRDTAQFIHELGSSIAAVDESMIHKLMLGGKMDHELPMFSFSTVETATGHFSEANKLGQGGFGPVFKGKLVNGQEVAVKRLSARSGQGVEEFTNEVVLISKVQHRNLVRLFGCCIKGEEKLLIYEYLPNKSLDTFIFDETKRLLLDWRMRMTIIEGVAQGILYLHKFSRLKIIHRDLKTSNILLDNNMNPKISDFGTAKIFGENESRANTNRIVGTYGYMSPEYAMDGLFSVKSDVFSFGVMMLEIISGKKATGFYQSNHSSNLVQYAWNLWKEERSSDLVDQPVAKTCSTSELERCVQVALLCVQENAGDRPTMSDVVSMLISSDADILPEPTQSFVSTLLEINNKNFPNSPYSGSTNDVTTSNTNIR